MVQVDRTDVYRILDAAANRAREGVRVVEDFVRFTLDDAHLTRLLKEFRHHLTDTLKTLSPSDLLASRDTERDVGTDIRTSSEGSRTSAIDVVCANLKRIQEALRTLEEFAKLVQIPSGLASSDQIPLDFRLEQLRYRLYSLEKAVLQTHCNRKRLAGRQIYLLMTESLCHCGFESVVGDALRAGVGIVQLREKSMSDRALVERGRQVRQMTRDATALFIMNDRPDLAVLTDADGVHVGQDELAVRESRRIVGPDRLIGVSTHNIEQARRAVLDGADYIGVGPVFQTETKQIEELAGLEFVRQVADEITLPWFAIGGINADNLDAVCEAGATRIAVCKAICSAENPRNAARELSRQLPAQSN